MGLILHCTSAIKITKLVRQQKFLDLGFDHLSSIVFQLLFKILFSMLLFKLLTLLTQRCHDIQFANLYVTVSVTVMYVANCWKEILGFSRSYASVYSGEHLLLLQVSTNKPTTKYSIRDY